MPQLQRHLQPSRSGFSLIMMSVVLTVGAIVFASYLPGKEAGDLGQKQMNTVKKLEKVEEAMRAFMAAHGRRPCPAEGQYAIGTANFGIEAATPGTCTGGTPAAPLGPDAATSHVVGGTIPTVSLGLPDEFAFDEWGRRITYVVDIRATKTATCDTLMNFPTNNGTGGVQIESTSAGTVLDNTMYAYISHGPSGHGAYPAQGAAAPANRINAGSTDTDEENNAGVNASFTYSTANFHNYFVQKDRVPATSGDTGFDNLVWYRQDLRNTCCLGPVCIPIGFVANGSSNDYTGWAVASGDVNGDGIADLIIGAPNGVSGLGKVYVVFGTKTGFPDPLPLSSLNGTNGFELDSNSGFWGGAAEGFEDGKAVAAGDVNGDGNADIIIGAYWAGNGAAYVVFGGKTMKDGTAWTTCPCTLNNTKTLNGTNGFTLVGTQASGRTGWAVASGDINGDGYADVLVGATNNNAGGAWRGAVYVIFGGATGPKSGGNWSSTPYTITALTNGTNGFEMDGNTNAIEIGMALATGDIDGDGKADMIIGTAGTSSYVVFGGTGPKSGGSWASSYTLSPGSGLLNGTNGFTLTEPSGGSFGTNQFLAAGDIDGDGKADIVIGNANANSGDGSVYVVFGGSGPKSGGSWSSTAYNLTAAGILNGTNGFELDGATGGDSGAGYAVTVSDINGDGKGDILTATPAGGNNYVGAVYTVFGGSGPKSGGSWSSTPYTLDSGGAHSILGGTNGFELDGYMSDDGTKYDCWESMAIATGDFNGDGVNDILIGAWGFSQACVYFGHKNSARAWPNTPYSLSGL